MHRYRNGDDVDIHWHLEGSPMRACRRYALKVALLSTIQCQKDPLKEPRPLLPSDPANWYNKEEGCALSCALTGSDGEQEVLSRAYVCLCVCACVCVCESCLTHTDARARESSRVPPPRPMCCARSRAGAPVRARRVD